jgi:general secretion pathway protein C
LSPYGHFGKELVNKVITTLGNLYGGAANVAWSSWLARLPVVANVVLVVLLANSLATLTWKFVPLPETAEAPAREVAVAAVAANSGSKENSYIELTRMNLFGEKQRQTAKRAPVVEKRPEVAPDTTLRLTLKGVFSSSDMGIAFAIIADASRKEETYRVGDKVPGGAVLKEVYASHVILFRNNRHETLRLPESKGKKAARNARTSSRDSNRRSSRSSRATLPSGNVTQVTGEAAAILSDYRNKLMNDPQSVMNSVRAEPYRRGGKLAGYRVFPGKDKQLMSQVGLEPGDVVTSVNGIALDNPIKGLEVMKSLSENGQVSVDILRNGVSQTFVVPVN